MSFVKSIFGGGKQKTTTSSTASTVPITYASPFTFTSNFGTGSASFGGDGSTINMNPAIQTNMNRFGQLTNQSLGRTGNYISELRGNANPFINARIRPLEESINNRRDELSRSMTRRGVVGSLANNEMLKFDNAAQRELADQRALMTNDTLNSLYQMEGLDRAVRGDVLTLADAQLKDDMARLGLSLEGLQLALSGAGRRATDVAGETQTTTTKGGSNILGGIGSIIKIAKAF